MEGSPITCGGGRTYGMRVRIPYHIIMFIFQYSTKIAGSLELFMIFCDILHDNCNSPGVPEQLRYTAI